MSESFKRILVPLDGSRLAESALPVAVMMAQCLDAKIVLIHIIEEHAPHTIHGEPHLTSAQEAGDYLDKIMQQYGGLVAMEHHVNSVVEDHGAESIAAHLDELNAGVNHLCTL